MPDNKHKQWLYKTMKDEGVEVPSYDDFNTDMDDENVRGWYHAKLEELGYDAKSREEFDSAMGYAPATKSEQTRVKKMEQPYVQAQSGAGTYTPGANVKLPSAKETLRENRNYKPKAAAPKASSTKAPAPKVSTAKDASPKAEEEQQRPGFMPIGMSSFGTSTPQNMVEQGQSGYQPTTLREASDAIVANDADDAVSKAWDMAEQRTREAQSRANRDYVSGSAIVPGQEAMGTSLSAMEASNRAIRMSEHDIERMAEDAWNAIPEEQKSEMYAGISQEILSRYPNASAEDIQRSAEQYARMRVNQKMWEKAVEMNAPKSATDYFFRKVVGANAVRKIEEGLSRSIMGTTGDMYAREVAEQRFEQSGHKVAGVAGTFVGMAVDPMMWIAGVVGSAATKGSMWLGGKIVGEAAARRAATTFAGKVATRAVGGAANFAAFEGMGEALDQYQHGGVAASPLPKPKKIGSVEYLPTDSFIPHSSGEYSVGDILEKMGHGAVMGGTIGVIGVIIGNVSENAVHATNTLIAKDGVRAAVKSGIRTGEIGVSTVAEGTIFAVPDMISVSEYYNEAIEALSDERSENYIADEAERAAAIERLERKRKESVMDVWDDSMVMMLGFKAQGAIKSAPKRIAELAARGDGRIGFVERLNRALDGSAPELALTKDEEAELDAAGYTDLKELTKDYNDFEGAKGVRVDAETGAEVEGELPYNRFTELMQDGRVSEAARAKMYYYISGKQLPMSTVMGAKPIIENTDENGRVSYTVQSFGANGIITSKTYTSKSRAEADVANITRQAELNSLYIGERYYDNMSDKKDMYEACKTIGDENGVVADMLYDMMQKDPADMSEVERELAEEILGEYYATRGNNTSETLRNGRYAGIDGIIRKPANKRSEREQQFLNDYIEELYADAKRESMGEDPISDNGESADFKNGYNATTQEAKDIYVGLSLAEREPLAQAKLQEEYRGVMKRIADECDYLAAMERKNMSKMQHKDDKGLHEVRLNRHIDDEEGDIVYIVNGTCEQATNGDWVGDKSVVVYDPYTGERKQMFPATDFKELGHVTSAEEVENGIMQGRQRNYENRVAEVTNRVELEPGDRFPMPDGQNAQVIGVDGDNVTVLLGDGTQTSISQAELQRQNDEAAMAYYRERFGEPTAADNGNNGIVKGAPASYEPGMSIIVKDDDGNEQNGVVVGRSRSEGMANHVEDPNGPFVTYVLANGLEYHDTPAELEKKVSGYVVENEGSEELPAKPASEAGHGGEGGEEPIAEGAPIAEGKPIAEGAPVASGPAEPIADAPAAGETPEVRMEGAMPIGDDGNPMWLASAPADGHEYLYKNSGLERDEANEFVAAKIAEAEKAAKAIEKKKPKMSTDLAKYKAEKEAWQNDMDAAQGAVDYWKDVKGVEDGIEAEAAARIEEEQRAAEEARKAEEAEKARVEAERVKAEEEAKAKAEAERVEAERKAAEDAKREKELAEKDAAEAEAARVKAEEEARAEAERKAAEEKARLQAKPAMEAGHGEVEGAKGDAVKFDSETKTWSGIPSWAEPGWDVEQDGVVTFDVHNITQKRDAANKGAEEFDKATKLGNNLSLIRLEHNNNSGEDKVIVELDKTGVRNHTAVINAVKEEGYDVELSNHYAFGDYAEVRFDNFDDAMKFVEHVRELETETKMQPKGKKGAKVGGKLHTEGERGAKGLQLEVAKSAKSMHAKADGSAKGADVEEGPKSAFDVEESGIPANVRNRQEMLDNAVRAYNDVLSRINPMQSFGGDARKVTFEDFSKQYEENNGSVLAKYDKPYLQGLFDYVSGKLEKLVDEREKKEKEPKWFEINRNKGYEDVEMEAEAIIAKEKDERNSAIQHIRNTNSGIAMERKLIQKASELYGEYFVYDTDMPNDVMELASLFILGKNSKIAWHDTDGGKRGFAKELGMRFGKGGDLNSSFMPYIAKKGEGRSFYDVVTSIYNSVENWPMGSDYPRFQDDEIRDAVIELFMIAQTPNDIKYYMLNNAIERAEDAISNLNERYAVQYAIAEAKEKEEARILSEFVLENAKAISSMSEEEFTEFLIGAGNAYEEWLEEQAKALAELTDEQYNNIKDDRRTNQTDEGRGTEKSASRGSEKEPSQGSNSTHGTRRNDSLEEGARSEVRKQKDSEGSKLLSESETKLRDSLVDAMRRTGLDVITEEAEGQRVLDEAKKLSSLSKNGRNKKALETASVAENEQHLHTVVSSADGAKILKNLEIEKKYFEGVSNKPIEFIGKMAKALGAKKHGSNSQYATFEAKNGNIVTIRLADHNSKVSTFDNNGENEGISIVITAKGNNKITNDGNAHIVEYYYDAIKLRRAEGKPLVSIISSIEQALYSGEYTDNTGIAEREEVNENDVKLFRTSEGEVYGFVKDGKVYIDPRVANAETPIHEYSHLWGEALRKANPKAWEQLKKQLSKDKELLEYVKGKYPEIEDEDALMDEVFAQYSGKRGAERMREEMQKDAGEDGSIEDSHIAKMFARLKDILDKFWDMARDLFAGKVKGLNKMKASDFADMALNDIINGINPNNITDSDRRTMMGCHNISEDKLRKVFKNGGFANPSMAVVDTRKGVHTDYGEITLIPRWSMMEKSSGRNAGTWTADAWTPTYPRVYRKPSKATDKAYKEIKEEWKRLGGDEAMTDAMINRLFNIAYNNGDDSPRLEYQFLLEKGMQPEIVKKPNKYDKEFVDYIEAMSKETGIPIFELSGQKTDEIGRYLADRMYGRKVEEHKEKFNEEPDEKVQGFLKDLSEEMWVDNFARIDSYIYDSMKKKEEVGKTDVDKTRYKCEDIIRYDEKLQSEYKEWLDKIDTRLALEEKLFSGYDRNGNNRYVANTIENASKLMNRGGQNGNFGWTGTGQFIAKVAPTANTIDKMRAAKDKLVSKELEEKHEESRAYIQDELIELSKPLDLPGDFFAGEARIEELATIKGNMQSYAKREWGVELSDEWVKRYNELVDYIKNEYPVFYFETKFNRPVGIEEFDKAVVPSSTAKDIISNLEANGIEVSYYETGSKGDRERAVLDAVKGDDRIMFQKGESRRYRDGDDVERKSYDERVDSARKVGYTKKQYDAYIQREWNNMRTHGQDLVDKLGLTDKVEIVDTIDEAGRKGRAKGWYDEKTGKITVVMMNNGSADDICKTILHEAVGHYGLRELFGERFDQFLDNVYDFADRNEKFEIYRIMAENNVSEREATEELLSQLAEETDFDGGRAGFWEKVRSIFLDMMHKIGLDTFFIDKITVGELKYILWRSYKNLTEPGRFINRFKGDDDAEMRKANGVAPAYAEEGGIRFRDGETPTAADVKKEVAEFLNPDMLNINESRWRSRHNGMMDEVRGLDIANGDDIDRSMSAIEKGLSGSFSTYFNGKNLYESEDVPEIVKDAFANEEYDYKEIGSSLNRYRKSSMDELDSYSEYEIQNDEFTRESYEEEKARLQEIEKGIFWYNSHKGEMTLAPTEFFDEDGNYIGAKNVETTEPQPMFRGDGEDTVVEKDKETLKALDKEPVEYGYRNVEMREEMDMLSPMGAKLKGNGKEAVANIPFSFLEYERSVEHPELVDENGKIDLVKANGKPLSKVDYNPYIHIRPTKVNYQFAEAWNRPGLIFIKTAYPKSELESGYQADKAKLAVGRHDWNGGELILSRWDKPVGIVPWSEIADDWMAQYGEKGVPFNRLHPMLVPILESRGMKILPPDGNVGAACKEAYESWRENGTLNTKGAIDDARIGEINKMLENRMSNEPRTMREAASEYATKLNANVNIIEDAEGLTGRKAKAKGWYDMSTGEVNVVIGNHKDVGDVIATISHEVIGHKGLRELVGEEGYDAFLDEVYDHLEDALKERVDERWAREHVRRPETSHEQKRREAVDELLAEMAEKPFEEFSEGERTLWQKIKRKVRELLDKLLGGGKLPGWFKIGDNEIRYMLWRSKEKMERGKEDPIDVARDIVKREELGLDFKDGEDDDTDPDGPGNGGGRPRTAARKGAETMDENGVISSIKDIAGAKSYRNNSAYVSGETEDGETYTIRISDHAANESNFSNHDEDSDYKLSIVVSSDFDKNRQRQEPMTNERSGRLQVVIRPEDYDESFMKIAIDRFKKSGSFDYIPDDIRYRDGEEEELKDIMKDGSMGMAEKLTAAKLLIVERNREDAEARRNAMRSLGGNLADIRRATGLQKQFDKTTVKRVADLARVMVSSGLFNDIQRGEMRRLLSIVKNSAGKDDLSSAVNTMYDMMLNNNLNTMRGALDELTKIKAGKVDAKGVEVQGKLDVNGQIMLKSYKKGVGLSSAELEDKIADAMNRMASEDDSLAEEASMEYMGLTIARDFVEGARECLEEIDDIKDMMRHVRRDTTEQREYYESLVDAERDAKIDLIESYANVISNLGEAMKGSIERAKSFVEEEKDNAKKIQHFANSDTQGKKKNEHYQSTTMSKIANGVVARALLSPLSTFDQMLRLFGSKSANGEGYLYNHFMRGVVDARTREIKGYREKCAILDDKVRELFGGKVKNLSDLISYIGKMPKMDVMFMDGGSMEPHKLNQGNLMYIYMVDKMSDGRMKLRKMGITSEAVEDITNELNPQLRIMADWIQEEFLVDTRNEYNKTHKALFGAPMSSIENYFPLKINSGSRTESADKLDIQGQDQSISTTTGSIIKRRRNNLALDLLNANAIEVLVDHISQMEHWNAYASFNRDLNVLRTYTPFRNKVKNMNTVYGSGEELWDNFNRVCRMAAGTYDPARKKAKFDKAIVNINRNVATAKVSFRLWTAIKQLSSIPAFFANARADYMAEGMIAPWKAWEWAMDNLPIFEERWKSRMAGDPRLMKSNKDWKSGRANAVQVASRIGMSPNAFMDALAVSIGSYAIYKTKFGQYKREGFTEEYADKRAKQDAVIAFNQSQQSNEGPFTAPVQVDRTVEASTFTLFRNASMGYQRQAHDALRNTMKTLTPGYRGQSIAFMEKQLMREGLSEEQAKKAATRRYARQVFKNPLNLAIFGWLLPYLWDLMAYAPYLIFGDDDEKKSEMKEDAWQHSKFGWLEGLAGGDVISEGGKMLLMDDINADYLRKELPLTSDLHKMLQNVQNKKYQAVVNDIMNIIVQIGIGVNPQSATDIALAIMDACGNDVELAHEATIMIARIAQVPQSQIEGLYFDEVGLSGDEVSKYTPAELAKRYAEYKVKRGAIYSPWTWEDEDAIEKKEKTSKSLIKERVERLGEKDINDKYLEYEEVYKELAEIQKEAKKWESKDFVRFAQAMDQLKSDKNKYDIYMRFKELDKTLNKLVERYMKAQSGEEAAKLHEQIIEYKADMVKRLEEGNN